MYFIYSARPEFCTGLWNLICLLSYGLLPQWEPTAYCGDRYTQHRGRRPVVPAARDPDWCRNGEEDPRPRQEHKVGLPCWCNGQSKVDSLKTAVGQIWVMERGKTIAQWLCFSAIEYCCFHAPMSRWARGIPYPIREKRCPDWLEISWEWSEIWIFSKRGWWTVNHKSHFTEHLKLTNIWQMAVTYLINYTQIIDLKLSSFFLMIIHELWMFSKTFGYGWVEQDDTT